MSSRTLPAAHLGRLLVTAVVLPFTFGSHISYAVAQDGPTITALEIRALIGEAAQSYKQRDYSAAAKKIALAQTQISKVISAADESKLTQFRPLYLSVKRARSLLIEKGQSMPPLVAWPKIAVQADGESTGTTPIKPSANKSEATVSFTKQIVPILTAKCGRCHIRGNKGGVRLSSYASLMRGSEDAGVIVFAGDDRGSRLIEVIESGDMPRGGLQVAGDELLLLRQWIREGAKFDGNNTGDLIAAASPPGERQPMPFATATGNEKVSFSKDLAPVLAQHCLGCHDNQRRRGGLSLATFSRLLRGGDSGAPVSAGNPETSLLIAKLEGTADGQRMPQGRPPLPSDVIDKFRTWVTEGARFDGTSPQTPVADLAELLFAASATAQQLTDRRAKLATANWNLALPDERVNRTESQSFLVVGQASNQVLDDIAQAAEAQLSVVRSTLNVKAAEAIPAGRITLFVLERRYDYSEFGTMVEQRQLPRLWSGHWRKSPVDAYGVIIRSEKELEELQPAIAEIVAGLYVASTGALPEWISLGAARWFVNMNFRRDPMVRQWDSRLAAVAENMEQPDDILQGRMDLESVRLGSYGVVKMLAKDRTKLARLLDQVHHGEPFSTVFQKIYGATPQETLAIWKRRGGH